MRTPVEDLVSRLVPVLTGDPVYEIGSRLVEGGGNCDLRKFFPGRPYVGVDIEEGPGVDLTVDLASEPLHDRANTLLCLEVLEHAAKPAELLTGIRQTLKETGWALFSMPFNFQLHSPPDYRRWTPEGLSLELRKAGFLFTRTFWSEPDEMPDTVAALAWRHPPDVERLTRADVAIREWKARWGHSRLPKAGETYLHCGHEGRKFTRVSSLFEFLRPDGSKAEAHWIAACAACANASGGIAQKIAYTAEATY